MIGERLKKARKKAKLSQEKVAEKLNVSRSNISKYENNKLEPNIQTIKILCGLYGTTSDYLLGIGKEENKVINNNNVSIKQGDNNKTTFNINNN